MKFTGFLAQRIRNIFLADETRRYNSPAEAIIGTKSFRYGPCPNEWQRASLALAVEANMRLGRPIPIQTLWGGIKGYGLFSTQHADFLDMMALKRFIVLQQQLGAFGTGAQFMIVVEDVLEMLQAQDQLAAILKMNNYVRSLEELIGILGMGEYCHVMAESMLVAQQGIDYAQYVAQIVGNAESLFSSYTNKRPELLIDIGWTGEPLWDHYLTRCATEYRDLEINERVKKVSLYFGNALARKQLLQPTAHAIKLSFCPYPKGVSEQMYRNRVEYKIKPNKDCNKTCPPWAGFGYIDPETEGWTYLTVNECREDKSRPEVFAINDYELTVRTNA